MAHLIARTGNELTIEVKVTKDGSLLEAEDAIQNACNEVELLATEKALKNFDTDGSPPSNGGANGRLSQPPQFEFRGDFKATYIILF